MFSRQTHHAFDSGQGQGIGFVAHAHDQRLADCQGERQADGEARTLARGRVDEQATAELFDFGGDDVHADSASRRLRDMPGRAEAGFQNQLHGLFVGELCLRIRQSQGHGLFANQPHADPGAVIGDHDHHLRSVALQTDRDAADIRFAERRAALRGLNAVHHGIAQHVFERRNHALQHLPVEFRGGTLHHQLGLLAGVVGCLPHQAREALYMALEGHHAGPHQAVLQLSNDPRLLGQQILRFASQGLEQALNARHVARGFGERA